MAYDKHTWTCDEPITVERLNHIEDGIEDCCGGGGAGLLIFTVTSRSATADECGGGGGAVFTYSHSWQEVFDALSQGHIVIAIYTDGTSTALQYIILNAEYDTNDNLYVLKGFYISTNNAIVVNKFEFDDTTSKTYVKCTFQ